MTLEERKTNIDTMSNEELESHHKALFNAMIPGSMAKSLIAHCETRMETLPKHPVMVENGDISDFGGN